ncbi:MAG: SpoIIE family protein phosphatase [Oscillospiraceae bacterium]|nr:SpoIIE family protein phosphatase [Oscillospiraceae bacterium]
MKRLSAILHSEFIRVPALFLLYTAAGALLSAGHISTAASPLAAAVAAVIPPLYACAVLIGTLLTYAVLQAPEGMQYLLCCLVCICCVRIFFREQFRPHILGVLASMTCALAGFVLDVLLRAQEGRLPLYLLEALLIGMAAYFLADAAQVLRTRRTLPESAGRSFTYSMCYLLAVAALCSAAFPFCNVGRAAGIAVTLLAAKQMRQSAGALCGALTACGAALCSVRTGTPLLFLPVTGMLAGYLSALPNALYIPVFFVLQALSSAVLDSSSALAGVLVELLFACGVYALCSHIDLSRFLPAAGAEQEDGRDAALEAGFRRSALGALSEETAAVMQRLVTSEPDDPIADVREAACASCKNFDYCWKRRRAQTMEGFEALRHAPHAHIEALDGCIRRPTVEERMRLSAYRSSLSQVERVHLLQRRSVTLEYLRVLEQMLQPEHEPIRHAQAGTRLLRKLLHRCGIESPVCFMHRLRSGRLAAQVYISDEDFPMSTVCRLLEKHTGVPFEGSVQRNGDAVRAVLYEAPPYRLDSIVLSRNAPGCERCGDQTDCFTDAVGNCFLLLSDGMGSGNSASLAARISVRALRRMLLSGMGPDKAIRLVNTMLLSETNTESFATLDVLAFDADSGECALYKCGAAPTLMLHGSQVHRIAGMSYPVGMLPDAQADCRRFSAVTGDTAVLVSDGISEAEYPYIAQLLRRRLPLNEIAQDVFRQAQVFHAGTVRDDMTIILARMVSTVSVESAQNSQDVVENHVPSDMLIEKLC